MDSRGRHLFHNDYTAACICPMGVELAAVEVTLDEIHESLPSSRDQNGYTLGRIGTHNIVVAVIPSIGNNRAASVAIRLLNDFRSIRFGLLVGIGGGLSGEDDIRLGDVVVSKANNHIWRSGTIRHGKGQTNLHAAGAHWRRFLTATTVKKGRFLAIHLEMPCSSRIRARVSRKR
jgi:hypothetical protein